MAASKGKATSKATSKAVKKSPRSKRGQGDWTRVQAAMELVLTGKSGNTRTGAKVPVVLTAAPKSAWWNFVWENRKRETRIYKALLYRGNALVSEGSKHFLVLDAEQVAEMRKAYRAAK
jgi:hypothetical protein